MSGHAGAASDALRAQIAGAVVMAIRAVANESDRDSIVRWFINARDVMLDSDLSKPEIVKRLYASIDTMQVARLTANTVITGLRSFQASDLPLPLKLVQQLSARKVRELQRLAALSGFRWHCSCFSERQEPLPSSRLSFEIAVSVIL
jgi:hypothetical protein